MNKEQINKLVEDTLNSIDGIRQAEANTFLYSKIKEKASRKKTMEKFSLGYGTKFLLVFAILIVINAFTLLIYSSNQSTPSVKSSTKQDINSFINEYSLENTNYNY